MPIVDQFLFGDFDDEFKVAFFDYWYQATLLEETLRTALTRLGQTPRPKATFGQMLESLFGYVDTLESAPEGWDLLKLNLEKFRDERNLLGHSTPSMGMEQIGEQTYEDDEEGPVTEPIMRIWPEWNGPGTPLVVDRERLLALAGKVQRLALSTHRFLTGLS